MTAARWSAAAIAVAVIAVPALAGAVSGRQKDVTAAPMAYFEQFVPANVGYTFETRNLAPSTADTVIHVQDGNDANGGFVAGNDDFTGLASRVTIGPSASDRFLQIIVRAYGSTSGGTAQLVRTASTGAVAVDNISFGGVSMVSVPGGIVATGHVFTVEQQGGANDTILLVVSGSRANAIQFDDDDGIDRMSWLHLNTACAAGSCLVIPGIRVAGAPAGATTVIWDEGSHAPTACDADGISDSLEQALGTDPCNNDTDGDGLPDGAETMGVVEGDASHPAVKLPTWGADPLRKDVFVELDWVECTTANGKCGDNLHLDLFQTPPDVAIGAASFYAPDVTVHFDTGVTNTDPATRTTYGNWGGATRIADGTAYCQMLTPSRVGLFHHGIIAGNNGGGQADSINGFCFTAGNFTRGSAIAHEIGHGFGLAHGGLPSNDFNCKPHYRSIMNYSYLYDPLVKQFSRGEFSSVVLNPIAMNEAAGLGTSDQSRIGFLAQPPWNYSVGATGSVDWNRDGVPGAAGTTIGASPAWAPGSCEQSIVGREDLHLGNGPTAAWVRPASGVARHYVLSRTPGGGDLQARYSTDIAGCRQQPGFPCAHWVPAAGTTPAVWPIHKGGNNAPIATRLTMPDGTDRLAVVYSDIASHLVLDLLRVDASGTESVTSMPVGTATEVVTGDAAVVAFNGKLVIFGVVAGQVRRWEFNPASSTFAAPVTELYSTGSAVTVGLPMAITTGYQSDNTAQQLFGIFPSPGASPNTLTMARYDAATARWIQYPATVFSFGSFRTSVRPGIAFVPFSPSTPKVGRFFLIWDDGDLRTSMTQGNDITAGATSRALKWLFQLDFQNIWAVTQTGVGMAFDPQFDLNPRATWTHFNGFANVAPLADGIYNQPLRDFNDYATIVPHLACSLTRTCQ